MKKLLSKKWFMITSIAVAVAMLVFYIIMLARPISYGMNYKYSTSVEGEELTTIVNVKNNKTAIMTVKTEFTTIETEMWIYYHDNYIYIVGSKEEMKESDYDAEVLYIEDNRAEAMNYYKDESMLFKTGAFKMEVEGDELKCNGAVVFSILMGIVEMALIGLAITSSIFALKKKPEEKQETTESKEVA